MNNEDKILVKLSDHDEKFDRVIEKLVDHEGRLDRIEQRLDQTATKEDLNRLVHIQDEVLGILRRLDQERVFTNEHIKRIELRLDHMEAEVNDVKQDLKQTKVRLKIE